MRYAQGGGLTAYGRRRREQARLEAARRFEQGECRPRGSTALSAGAYLAPGRLGVLADLGIEDCRRYTSAVHSK